MEALKFENNSGRQRMLALACTTAGSVLAIGFRDYSGQGMTNSLAGFLLGMLLLVIGISGVLTSGKQTILIDPRARRIVVTDVTILGTKKQVIAFGDIADIQIGYLGKSSNLVNFYYLSLKLRDGKRYPLFSPGRFFEGGSDRSVMESRRQRLEEYLNL